MCAVTQFFFDSRDKKKEMMLKILLKLQILKTRVASLTRSCCGHLSVSTTAAFPILEILQLVIKHTWALSSSVRNCLVTLFQVNIISYSFFLSLSFSLMPGVEACLQAGKWVPETEHEAGEGPQRSRVNRCSLVNETQTNKTKKMSIDPETLCL